MSNLERDAGPIKNEALYRLDAILVAKLLHTLRCEGLLDDDEWDAVLRFWEHRGDNKFIPANLVSVTAGMALVQVAQ